MSWSLGSLSEVYQAVSQVYLLLAGMQIYPGLSLLSAMGWFIFIGLTFAIMNFLIRSGAV